MEVWKKIEFGEGKYEASNLGNIKSLDYRRRGVSKILKPGITAGGYTSYTLSFGKNKKPISGHRIIAELFVAGQEKHKEVNHKNEIKTDNAA